MPVSIAPEPDWLAQHEGFLSDYIHERTTQRISELLSLGKLPDGWIKSLEPFADELIAQSCLILFPEWKTEQERQELDRFFDEFIDAIAYLAFCPGGIKIFGFEYLAYF
jgi:hypothetical protein